EHYEVYSAVEDLVESVERRGDVEDLLDELLAATEECILADAAASASAAAAAEDLAAKSRRTVSELRMLFAKPGEGAAPSASGASGASKVGVPAGAAAAAAAATRAGGSAVAAAKRAAQMGRTLPSADAIATASGSGSGTASRVARGGAGARRANVAARGGGGEGGAGGGGGAAGRLAVPKRPGLSTAAAAAGGGDDRLSPRRSSDPTGRSKAGPGSSSGGFRGGDSNHPSDGLSAVTRRRLRGVASSNSGFVNPRAAGETAGTKKTPGGGGGGGGGGNSSSSSRDFSAPARRARFARQRSRSLSTSPTPRGRGGGRSSPSTPPRPATSIGGAMARSRGRASHPPPLFDPVRSDGVGAWGAAARGRTPSGSPRAAAPSSPRSSGGFSRSPSPHRARGIPRPYGRGGGGGGGGSGGGGSGVTATASRLVSPRTLRQTAIDRSQSSPAPSVASSESSIMGREGTSSARGGGGGGGGGSSGGGGVGVGATLSEPAIEAAALSFMLRAHDKGAGEGGTKGVSIVEGMAGEDGGGGGGGATAGVDGASPSRRSSSRATSFDSVGDVVVVGGLALGNHSALPGDVLGNDDWLQSQPSTPTVSQMRGPGVFEEGKYALVSDSAASVSGAGKGATGSTIGSGGGSGWGKTPPPGGRKVPIDKASPSVGTLNRKTLQSGPSGGGGGGGGGGGQGKGSKAKKQSTSFSSRMNFQSALARFLGGGSWGGDRMDWTVPLGAFKDGRPRLAPGRRGEFVPVFDDQPTTIIAYSLSSHEYYETLEAFYRHRGATGMPTTGNAGAGGAAAAAATAATAANATGAGADAGVGAGAGGAGTTVAEAVAATAAAAAAAASAAAAVAGSMTSAGRIAGKTPAPLLGSPLMGGIRYGTPLPTAIAEGTEDPVSRLPTLSGGGGGGGGDGGVVGGGGGGGGSTGDGGGGGSSAAGNKLEEAWWVMNEDMSTLSPPPSGVTQSATVAVVRRGSALGAGGGGGGSSGSASSSTGGGAQTQMMLSKPRRKMLPDGKEGESRRGAGGGGGAGVSPLPGLRGKRLERRRLYDSPEVSKLEAQMRSPAKTHVKHRFSDTDAKGVATCKFLCHTFWATQFRAVRRCYFAEQRGAGGPAAPDLEDEDTYDEMEQGYIRSLCMTTKWDAKGGKSGATFSKTADERFVVKFITKTELQMFLDCALHYFEFMSKAFFHKLPTVLCKIVGVYQIGYHNKITGKRQMDQLVVMQNIFYQRNISLVFDLKGSTRSRYVRPEGQEGAATMSRSSSVSNSSANTAAATAAAAAAAAAAATATSIANAANAALAASGDLATESGGGGGTAGAGIGGSAAGGGGGGGGAGAPSRTTSSSGGEAGSSTGVGVGAGGGMGTAVPKRVQVLLDENFMEYTGGQPLPMQDFGK
ncbi:unnamed protein product, partial [Laminaria digitata]